MTHDVCLLFSNFIRCSQHRRLSFQNLSYTFQNLSDVLQTYQIYFRSYLIYDTQCQPPFFQILSDAVNIGVFLFRTYYMHFRTYQIYFKLIQYMGFSFMTSCNTFFFFLNFIRYSQLRSISFQTYQIHFIIYQTYFELRAFSFSS